MKKIRLFYVEYSANIRLGTHLKAKYSKGLTKFHCTEYTFMHFRVAIHNTFVKTPTWHIFLWFMFVFHNMIWEETECAFYNNWKLIYAKYLTTFSFSKWCIFKLNVSLKLELHKTTMISKIQTDKKIGDRSYTFFFISTQPHPGPKLIFHQKRLH